MRIEDEIYRLESELRNDKVFNEKTGKKYGWAVKAEKRLAELYILRDNQQKIEVEKYPLKTDVKPIPEQIVKTPTLPKQKSIKFEQITIFDYLKDIGEKEN